MLMRCCIIATVTVIAASGSFAASGSPRYDILWGFDKNFDCFIDDSEAIRAIELWVDNQVVDQVIDLVVRAWASGKPFCRQTTEPLGAQKAPFFCL